MTQKKTLQRGESYFGKQDKTLDGIMRDAAVIVREPSKEYYGVLYYASKMSPDSADAREVVKRFFAGYLSNHPDGKCDPEELEAIVIGGRYQNNRQVDEGYFVEGILQQIVNDDLRNALKLVGIQNIPDPKIDPLAIKKVRVTKGGIYTIEQNVPEHNRHKPLRKERDYEENKMRLRLSD